MISQILLLVPVGVTASNINGITIFSGLNIPFFVKLIPLSNKNRAKHRNKYSKVEIVIIYIKRIWEVFSSNTKVSK